MSLAESIKNRGSKMDAIDKHNIMMDRREKRGMEKERNRWLAAVEEMISELSDDKITFPKTNLSKVSLLEELKTRMETGDENER